MSEAWGRGIAKIANGFAAAGLPAPAFAEFCGGMLVTMKRAEAKAEKVRNGGGNVRIESEKVRIENALSTAGVSKPTREKAMSLYSEFGAEKEFGESVVVESLGLSRRGASRLISILRTNGIVAHADGKGPGKYVFAAAAEKSGE